MTKLVVQEIFQFLCIHGFGLMVAVLALWLVAVVAIYDKHCQAPTKHCWGFATHFAGLLKVNRVWACVS